MLDVNDMTTLSKAEALRLRDDSAMTPAELVRHMMTELPIRRFSDVLREFGCDPEDAAAKKRLLDTLCAYHPELSRDSIRRKISNWFHDTFVPNERMDVIELCFALGLEERRAQQFLSYCTDGGFHMRDPVELCCLFALRTHRTWEQAKRWISALPPIVDPAGPVEKLPYTNLVRNAFAQVMTEEDFFEFLRAQSSSFGILRNTAYRYFMNYWNVLRQPENLIREEKEKPYSISKIVNTYLMTGLCRGKSAAQLDCLQRAVYAAWPTERTAENMVNRTVQVSRKCLLLLYVVTDGGDGIDMDDDWDIELTPLERLDNQVRAIDLMLEACGLRLLDLRNPFDQLILYSLRPENPNEMSMCEQLQTFLRLIFPKEGEAAPQ